jgi:HEPN domain-containing protein
MRRQAAVWVRKAEEDLLGARLLASQSPPLRDLACFHCQQTAEKYLKALLQELGLAVPKTHNLDQLLNLLLPKDATLAPLRRKLIARTSFAVNYRYPGVKASTRQMKRALVERHY